MLKPVMQLNGIRMAATLLASGLMAGWASAATPPAASAARPAAAPAQANASVAASGASSGAGVAERYLHMPLSFEANHGQTDSRVKFLTRGSGFGLYLTGQEAVLSLRKSTSLRGAKLQTPRLSANGVPLIKDESPVKGDPGSGAHPETAARLPLGFKGATSTQVDVIRMRLAGASAKATPSGEALLPGTVNYFRGNDPAKWHSAIETYSRVRYNGVYPGVDLVYYGNQQQLEYDFTVAPGADAKVIRVRFAGAQGLKLDAGGNLAIAGTNGSIAFHKPEVYQTIGGSKRPVTGEFKLLADGSVGFRIGAYDQSKALVIDPVLAYSTYLGGTSADFVVAVASDASGNAYVTGLTASEDFPLTPGAFQAVNYASPTNGVSTAFVSKINASGTALLYSTFIGGIGTPGTVHNQGDYGKAIAVDASGDAYITGYTYSADFPVTGGAFQQQNKAAAVNFATGFATKINPSGTALIYSTYLGGSQLDEMSGVAIDASGNAYYSGLSFSDDYPVTSGAYQTVNRSAGHNGYNLVLSKMNPAGSALIYSTYLGGSAESGLGLANVYWTNPVVVDKSGNAYVAGFSFSGDFPVTAGAYQTKNLGSCNITVSKLNPTGSGLVYSTYLGGDTFSYSEGLAVDSSGNAYVAGYTSDRNFPVTASAFQKTNKASSNTTYSDDTDENGFVTKLNPTGTALLYSTYLGGTTGPWGGDQIYNLALDSAGDAYVVGSAMSADFPVTSNAIQPKNAGATHCCDYDTYTSDGFVTELNPSGSGLIYSSYLGGSGTQNPNGPGGFGDTAYGVGLGPDSSVFVVGFTTSPNFPVTEGALITTYKTAQNPGFVARVELGAAATTKETSTTLSPSANNVLPGTAVTFTATVAPLTGSGVVTGNVVFSIDETTVATVALSASGKAAYSTSSLTPGAHYILASYAGSTTYAPSGDGLSEYVVPATPVVTPAGGTYTSQQTVTITTGTAGAVLYYTLDGTTPTVFSNRYTGPLIVNTSKTIKAVAVSKSDSSSVIASDTYDIVGSPAVLAVPAQAVTATGATLSATVNTYGIAGSYYFQVGTSKTALKATTTTALSASSTNVGISYKPTALTSKTTYYYQVVVTTAGGTCAGEVLSFTTN